MAVYCISMSVVLLPCVAMSRSSPCHVVRHELLVIVCLRITSPGLMDGCI